MFLFFQQKKVIEGNIVDLRIVSEHDPSLFNDFAHTIQFYIYLHDSLTKVGECDLRIGSHENLYYAGHIGYRIYEKYRGHHYAYEACLLLLDYAKKHSDMEYLYITCSPENIASQKTIEKLESHYLETTSVPKDHWLYKRGEDTKRIYRIDLV